jgi:hypothetical protein
MTTWRMAPQLEPLHDIADDATNALSKPQTTGAFRMLGKPTRTASPLDLIDSEIIQEQASALGRLGRGLEAALAALREFDAAALSLPSDAARTQRKALVAQAGHALWMFVVQRESCGMRDSRAVMRDYAVPPEVQVRMGLLAPSPAPGKRRRGA